MRKLSMTLVGLMLLLPSLASAYTLTVIATGASATNTIVVKNAATDAVLKTITAPGTYYVYPTVPVKATITGTTADFVASPLGGTYSVISGTTTAAYFSDTTVAPNVSPAAQTVLLNIKFSTAATYTITPSQASGGTLYVQGLSPLTALTTNPLTVLGTNTVNVAAYPLGTQKVTALITNYPVANTLLTACTGSAGQTCSFNLSGAALLHNQTVTATYAASYVTTAALLAPSSVAAGSTVTLDATGSTTNDTAITTFLFTISGNPAQTAVAPGVITFVAPASGTLTASVQVTTTNGTTSTSPTASISIVTGFDNDVNFCAACHNGRNPQLVQDYKTSPHFLRQKVSCMDCHNPNLSLQHPGNSLAVLYNACGACHFDTSGNVPLHPVEIGVNTCVTCHDPHTSAASWLNVAQSAHYNSITSGKYPASYVTSRAVCSNCHFATIANGINRHEWAISGHAATTSPAWSAYDFKTMNGCVKCHTATGFIAYSSGNVTAAWGDAADKTKEVLRCNGCHSDITNGTVRTIAPVRPYADDSYTHPDDGKSNVCLVCHSGTKNGSSITARIGASASFANMTIIDPHYMAAGGTMYGIAGYHFPGRTYTEDPTKTHSDINSVDSNNTVMGPCITCHKNSFFSHTFRPSWGNNPLCVSCHYTMDDAQLNGSKTALANALEVLRAQLAAKGFVYSPTYPYFSTTNWGLGVEGANTMGAAFNYILLLKEPGAYAHNPSYAKQLVLDSIDYLDNGAIDDSVATIALPGLVTSGAISQAAADSFNSYKAVSLCTTCHGGPANTATPMSTSAHPAHLTRAYGPSAYLGTSLTACQACHAYNSSQHRNGVVDVLNGAGSACANCHSGNVPAWGGTARLACTSCHSANPAVLPNGTAAPYKANFSSTGHGWFAAGYQCTTCHDPDSPHISGSLGNYVRLRLPNDNSQCGSCHNGTTAPAMSSHVLDKGETPNPDLCKGCHDVHGTSNLHMIRAVINGKTIAFTNTTTGFVKTVAPFDGLCQVCHTLTNHFRSGQTPDDHPNRNCLSCHSHTAAFAFKPAGNCDSCHGYPPVPAGFVGTQGNYSSARVEDYLGGSGAHTTEAHIKKTARPSEGWLNCTKCHADGSLNPATHTMSLPVTPSKITINVDDQFKFNVSLPLGPGQYSGLLVDGGANATGTCSNVKCHFQPTANWSEVK